MKRLWSMDKTLEESARAVIWKYSLNIFEKFSKIHRKISVLECLFNQISGLETSSFIEKWLQPWYFPVDFEKFLRTPIL